MDIVLPCISRSAPCVSLQTDAAKFVHALLSSVPFPHKEPLNLLNGDAEKHKRA